MALMRHDLALLDELADFLVVYSDRFVTLGRMRGELARGRSASDLNGRGGDDAKVLPWVNKSKKGEAIRECELCSSQFMHPVARLARVISTLPDADRTTAMDRFLVIYTPLVVRDHLIRLVDEATWPARSAGTPPQLQARWAKTMSTTDAPRTLDHAMLDRDLWLIGTAAEMLGANANRPDLVKLSDADQKKLKAMVTTGISLFLSKRSNHRETKNFQGKVVGSVSYFNGDFDRQEGMKYAGYTGKEFPSGPKKPPQGGSWDISHAYRIPLFLRSLYDNRAAIGSSFPTLDDLKAVANQYVYVVFNGNYSRPMFSNFFDGSDGWYRVGYHGKDFGYPPSKYCDNAAGSKTPCLSLGAVSGWGQLAFVNPDLERLQNALMRLAADDSASATEFKTRYYRDLDFAGADGKPTYSILLFNILSGSAEHFATGR
jgi:hypothetical protein